MMDDWRRHDGSPAQEQDIADIADGLTERGWSAEKVAESLGVTVEKLNAIMQASEELNRMTLDCLASGKSLPIH